MKQNYIKPETEIIELDTLDTVLIVESGQIEQGCAKGSNIFLIDDIDDTDDWSYTQDNDFNKSIFEED